MQDRKLEIKDVDFESVDDLLELKINEAKQKTQRRLAIISLAGVFIIIALLLFSPIPDKRIETLSAIISTSIVGLISIVGAYLGFSSWMNKSEDRGYYDQ